MNLNSISVVLQIFAHIRIFSKYFEDGNYYNINKQSRYKGKLAKAFSQFMAFMKMAQVGSITELSQVFELAEHFQPKFKKFHKRDPFDICNFLIWGLHEECNRAGLKKYRALHELTIRPGTTVI